MLQPQMYNGLGAGSYEIRKSVYEMRKTKALQQKDPT
jgi:hypothetical protein